MKLLQLFSALIILSIFSNAQAGSLRLEAEGTVSTKPDFASFPFSVRSICFQSEQHARAETNRVSNELRQALVSVLTPEEQSRVRVVPGITREEQSSRYVRGVYETICTGWTTYVNVTAERVAVEDADKMGRLSNAIGAVIRAVPKPSEPSQPTTTIAIAQPIPGLNPATEQQLLLDAEAKAFQKYGQDLERLVDRCGLQNVSLSSASVTFGTNNRVYRSAPVSAAAPSESGELQAPTLQVNFQEIPMTVSVSMEVQYASATRVACSGTLPVPSQK